MATSGTVATTTIDTALILEHAFRRVKVSPALQNPANVAMAKENLYLLLLNLANRGLNLWCVQSELVGLTSGKALYSLPNGTLEVLNVIYCQPSRQSGTDTSTGTSYTTELTATSTVRRVGLKFSTITASESVVLESSADGVTWSTVQTFTRTDWATGTWYWYDLTIATSAMFFRITTTAAISVTEFYLAGATSDLPVVQWNRDTWAVIPNKGQTGRPATNYYLERQLQQRLTLWPVPNNNYDHLQVFVQRQVQDVGTLSQEIEVPQRWVENIIWQLALRIGFEIPEVDSGTIQLVSAMADKVMIEVERDEGDGAPIMLQPNIGVYTR